MNYVEKILNLFKYIKELCSLKYTVVTNIDNQPWKCFLNDIPNDSENITVFYRDRVDDEASDNNVLLEVRKPEFQRCPEPPSNIIKWLEPGWDRFSNSPIVKETQQNFNEKSNNIERFENSAERVKAYEKWIELRNKWVEKQLKINKTRNFFVKLYQAYTDLERESETLEFVIGNGVIVDLNNQSICHPVLFKRVKFEFDSKENIIKICDTDTDPELYTLLFQEMSQINYGVVRELNDELREHFYHPLDRNETLDFLKTLTHRLCSESKFIYNENDEPAPSDIIITRWSPVFL